MQAFKSLSAGLSELADVSETFQSKTILGLLRSAPDLLPHIKHVKAMFKKPEDSRSSYFPRVTL